MEYTEYMYHVNSFNIISSPPPSPQFYRVPRIDPSGQTLILDRAQFLRIMDASKVLTQEERLAEQQRRAKEKEMASVSTMVAS